MEENFIRERITQLRMLKGVSEYDMSYSLGHNKGYINNIVSGKSLPSCSELLNICDYFEITPSQFFEPELKNPALVQRAVEELLKLRDEDIALLIDVMKRFPAKD